MPKTDPLCCDCADSDAYCCIPLHILVHPLQDCSMLYQNALLQPKPSLITEKSLGRFLKRVFKKVRERGNQRGKWTDTRWN